MKIEIVAQGFDFPEGPAWHQAGFVFLVNCNNDVIHRVTESGEVEEFGRLPGKGNGATFGPNGRLYVCDYMRAAVVAFDSHGTAEIECDSHAGVPFKGPNDLVFDASGTLYFTDPRGSNAENPFGGVYKLTPDGETARLADHFAFPNGLACKDGHLYVAESSHNRICRMNFETNEWSVFAVLPQGGVPDGIRFDAQGNLWIAHFNSGAVKVIDPSGSLISQYDIGGQKPTNLEFGGADGRTLYITEAATNTLLRMRVEIPGAKWR